MTRQQAFHGTSIGIGALIPLAWVHNLVGIIVLIGVLTYTVARLKMTS